MLVRLNPFIAPSCTITPQIFQQSKGLQNPVYTIFSCRAKATVTVFLLQTNRSQQKELRFEVPQRKTIAAQYHRFLQPSPGCNLRFPTRGPHCSSLGSDQAFGQVSPPRANKNAPRFPNAGPRYLIFPLSWSPPTSNRPSIQMAHSKFPVPETIRAISRKGLFQNISPVRAEE